ncbi:UNVERIFIED_CONTAM: hypothetical protein RMT77_015517 [Armadillidium vulgare]
MFLPSCFYFRNSKRILISITTVFGFFFLFGFYFFQTQLNFFFIMDKQQFQLRKEVFALEAPPFPLDPKCLREANEDNFDVEKEKEDFEFLKIEEGKEYKKILFYFHKYPHNNRYGAGHKIFEKSCCKEKRCFLTDRKDRIPFKEFDAVLIQHSHFGFKNIPKERTREQRWILVELEPPAYYTKGLEKYTNIFNWTMTYRRDSDISTRYGYVYPKMSLPLTNFYKMEPHYMDVKTLVKRKNKLAVWMVSHCETNGGRELFVNELQKYIDVDIYGKCGSLDCGDLHHFSDCYKKFEEEYKFYFSFENSICADYITEKFFNILRLYIVPVVYGAGDYSAVSPPHSYINVRKFLNAKSLAEYLLYLDSNDTAYMEYFKWKEDYISSEGVLARALNLCQLCDKLHTDDEEKVYPDMKEWFLKKADCLFCGRIPGVKRNFTKCYNTVEKYQNRLKLGSIFPIT